MVEVKCAANGNAPSTTLEVKRNVGEKPPPWMQTGRQDNDDKQGMLDSTFGCTEKMT